MSSAARRLPPSDTPPPRSSALPLPRRSTMRPAPMPRPAPLPVDLAPAHDDDDVDYDETPSLHTLARTWTESLVDRRELAPRSLEEELLEVPGVCEQLDAMASVAPPPIETPSERRPARAPFAVPAREERRFGLAALVGAFGLGMLTTLAVLVALALLDVGPRELARSGLAAPPPGLELESPTTAKPTSDRDEPSLPASAAEVAVGSMPTAPAAATPTPSLVAPQPFDPAVARAAVAAAAGRAQACNDGTGRGTARVAVTFASSGRATRALLDYGSPLAGSAVGSCIARMMSGAQMPPFEGGPVTVTRTVELR